MTPPPLLLWPLAISGDHPIFALPNVIVTPHVSAGTRDAFVTKLDFVFQNLEAFFDGRPIENQIDYVAEMAAQQK